MLHLGVRVSGSIKTFRLQGLELESGSPLVQDVVRAVLSANVQASRLLRSVQTKKKIRVGTAKVPVDASASFDEDIYSFTELDTLAKLARSHDDAHRLRALPFEHAHPYLLEHGLDTGSRVYVLYVYHEVSHRTNQTWTVLTHTLLGFSLSDGAVKPRPFC